MPHSRHPRCCCAVIPDEETTKVTEQDWSTVWLTLKLALLVTGILLLIATPLAWWLAQTRSRYKPLFNAALSLPMVLPPTVLASYLLLLLGPHGPTGKLLIALDWQALPLVSTELYSARSYTVYRLLFSPFRMLLKPSAGGH